MSPVQSARYNSKYSTNIGRRGCTAETREKIIQDLKDWAGKNGGAKVYWMNGMAGTGKTTIGYSLCEWLAKVGKLGGNFFCSRAEPSCRDANNIVPTLAFQLSQSSPAYRSALCKVLKEEPQASKLEVRWQFQKLIEGPIRAVKEAVLEDTVIVIDALDECDDGEAFRLLLETLLKLAPDLPFKIFLTSRPEPVIRQKMLAPGRSRSVLHLHDIEESVVEADIKKYLTDAFHAMSPRPSSYQVEQLAKRAGRLFIYAATAVRYIRPDSRAVVDSAARLKRVLGLTTGSGKQHEELDKLYTSVLSAAFDNLEADETDNIRLILWTVVCAREPVSLETIASLLSLTKDSLQPWLGPLRSVLFVQEGVDGLLAPFHASFPDYILQCDRSKQFHCNAAQHHELLANGCFDVMKAKLRFNICGLESSFVFDKDVPDLEDRVRKHISPTLSYACRY
jgi:nucleoside-triphosphatase THEP1